MTFQQSISAEFKHLTKLERKKEKTHEKNILTGTKCCWPGARREEKDTHKKDKDNRDVIKQIFFNLFLKSHFAAKDLCVRSSRVGKRHTDHQNSILEHYNLSFQGLPILCLFFN